MIQIKPQIDCSIKCSKCNETMVNESFLLTGMHNMAKAHCIKCNNDYFHELPVNAGNFYPGIIDAKTSKRSDEIPFSNWYLEGLEKAYQNKESAKVNIAVEKCRALKRRKVALLNTIDLTYGHSLFELLNASYYLAKEDVDLIIIVQQQMRWLVPEGVAEIWVVDIPFKKAEHWYTDLSEQVNDLLDKMGEVYLCKAFVQADSTDYQIEDYTRVKPFPLEEWDERLLQKPVVTMIWRYDKFWKSMLPKIFNNRFTIKFFPKLVYNLNNHLQHKWFLKFAAELKKSVPNVDFAIAGMDSRKRSLPKWIKDYRYPTHQDETAKLQCERYAESHLIIGCNGSSLVLPSCHAGAVINIVPGDSWAVSAGSFGFRKTSIGDTHFRYVMLPKEVRIARIVSIACSLIRDRSLVELHTSKPWRDHEAAIDDYAWSKFRIKIFGLLKVFNHNKGLVSSSKENN